MPAPLFKATHSATRAFGATSFTSTTVSLTNIVAKDYLLLVIDFSGGSISVTAPTGFTALHSATTDPSIAVFGKEAVGGETSVAVTHTGTNVGIVATVYVASEALLDVSALGAVQTTTTPTSPAVTTTGPDRRVIAIFGQTEGSTWTPGSGMTERSDVRGGTSTADASLMFQDIEQAAEGTTGTKTATSTLSVATMGVTVALKSVVPPVIESVGMLVGS